ncbi:MAG: hypothetical protein HY905_11515 [Deltaproteobacteria bacterium]|nr:hypothetical protein [Deltaproteobacteria bacterium]
MQAMERTATYTPRATLSLATLAFGFGGLSVLLDAVFQVSLRLPGHRALPGALALLAFAEVAAPVLLAAFAAAVPLVVVALGGGSPWLVMAWLVLAGVLIALRSARWRHAVWFLVLAGAAFGALRAGVLEPAPHHAPGVLRWGGHLGFGASGGLLAALLRRAHRRADGGSAR